MTKTRLEWIKTLYDELLKAEKTHKRYGVCFYQFDVDKDADELKKTDLMIEGKNCSHEEFIGHLQVVINGLFAFIEDEDREHINLLEFDEK